MMCGTGGKEVICGRRPTTKSSQSRNLSA